MRLKTFVRSYVRKVSYLQMAVNIRCVVAVDVIVSALYMLNFFIFGQL